MAQNLTIVRLNDAQFAGVATLDGAVADITGATLTFTAKWTPQDSDASAVFQVGTTPLTGISITNPAAGEFLITIPDTATSSLPYNTTLLAYDLLLVTPSGSRATINRGVLVVVPNVTR